MMIDIFLLLVEEVQYRIARYLSTDVSELNSVLILLWRLSFQNTYFCQFH
jgi:hypothetical protein